MKREKVSFVIPCYNSTNTIQTVVKEITETMTSVLSQYEYEIILVNDCSPDGTTYEMIRGIAKKDDHVSGINLSKNFGQPSAVLAGLNYARGDYVVCGDDDGQTPFCMLPYFFEKIYEGYDVVEARYVTREKRSLIRNIGTRINDAMACWLIDKPKGIQLTSFWLTRRYVVDEVIRYSNSYPYIGGLLLRATRNICNVDVEGRDRLDGHSGYNIKRLFLLWLNGFTSFSIKPLRLITAFGMLVSVLGFIMVIVTVARKMLNPLIDAGYSSTIAIILFMFGVVFIILGMLGEYIGRINIASNNAPAYVVRETVNLEINKDL